MNSEKDLDNGARKFLELGLVLFHEQYYLKYRILDLQNKCTQDELKSKVKALSLFYGYTMTELYEIAGLQ